MIQGNRLERTALLLGDLPGISVTPVMRPGEEPGTGDLEVDIAADRRVESYVGADNHGSRASGEGRAMVGAQANRLLKVGDELSVTALYSQEDLWLGRLAYALLLAIKAGVPKQRMHGRSTIYARHSTDLLAPRIPAP
ncbi:hypothetical protein HORIV_08450 [Vreelandella olivaria]|uniref:Uncharacterized protein n=1 Tax=Vreelandella olivaria TaxID=390919 RepID=A0ABN5WN83_9GAMM|nr:hypothetical protein HORIV_08450 [Halomonas olivaria]